MIKWSFDDATLVTEILFIAAAHRSIDAFIEIPDYA